MNNCLENIIGIYEGDFGCDKLPSIQNQSTTGLFVTQDPSYNHCRFRSGDSDCELIKLFLKNREEAYRLITTDLGAVLAGKIQSRIEYGYFIGQNEYGRYLNASEVPPTPFIEIATEYREGAYVEIQKIALMLTRKDQAETVNVDLRVKRKSDGEVIKTYTISVTSLSTHPKQVEYLRVPCDGETYIVEYVYDSTKILVPETFYHCGCGDKIKKAFGFIKEQHTNGQPAVKSFGISIYAIMACFPGAKVCALLKNPDYRSVIGYMIRKKVIELTLKNIYFRQEVNKFTLLTNEDFEGQLTMYEAEYNERLKWFAYQTSFEVDGFCLTCSGSGMRKVNLMTGR